MNLRTLAARIVYNVVVKQISLPDALEDVPPGDRAFVQAICYGVCRWYFRLDAIAQMLLEKPLKSSDQDIYILLLVGLYQLTDMRVPPHAAVAETVSAVKDFKKIWAKGLVNAILRNYQRNADTINNKVKNHHAHPAWMVEKIKHDWPNDWQTILTANNQHPPFSLRVNQRRISRENYLAKLTEQDIKARILPETKAGIELIEPMDVQSLPGFKQGEISVQDGAAQLAAELLALAPGQRVLDACAAPGGKTVHILEMQPDIELVAVDCNDKRLQRVAENLQRCIGQPIPANVSLISADVGNTKQWWTGELFDRILLDAPCSASGVIRRHPDIKLLRQPEDIATVAAEQLRLLKSVWELLKTDGLLVYATCSIFTAENREVIELFLAEQKDAAIENMIDILPGMQNRDGFYFAVLRKR